MDLYKAIQDLYAEKEKLERVISEKNAVCRAAYGVPLDTAGLAARSLFPALKPGKARRTSSVAQQLVAV